MLSVCVQMFVLSSHFRSHMDTDHINYQQQIAQSQKEEKNHELIERIEDVPKQDVLSIGVHPHPDDYQTIQQNTDNTINALTPIQQRQRLFTLLVIAFIALLTGTRVIQCSKRDFEHICFRN